ncbi:uncharacterized protein LOC114250408 [Bombyx mandarina]|uniref:Uncharacterized protein LOC114250408 n=1 Tax=Bombyx mandarina TaxID=7092 RepID=A0A6J2KDL1_BOMMA|nr:uncharacterized protein LOC114250408 [Bombyx mandarina]
MCDLEILKLESRTITSSGMVESYLKQHSEFRSINVWKTWSSDNEDHHVVCYGKKIHYHKFMTLNNESITQYKHLETMDERKKALKKLAKLLDEKTNLICEMEFYTRKQSENDVRTYLNLIKQQFELQNIEHHSGKMKPFDTGTTAVVTARCDLDSAVDMFIASSSNAPWRLRSILVQENVYDHFKRAMKWKHDLGCSEKKPDIELSDLTYEIEGKKFIFDYTGRGDVTGVTIEAYRTTKELLQLLDNCKPYYLSLWASDVAEADEVALKCCSNVVWSNDLANFASPVALFNIIFPIRVRNAENGGEIKELVKDWTKLSFGERKHALLTSLQGYIGSIESNAETYRENEFAQRLVDEQSGSLITHGNVLIKVLKRTTELRPMVEDFSYECIRSALFGLGTVVDKIEDGLLEAFKANGVPISRPTIPIVGYWTALYRYKLIWSSYGTIFAN